VSFSADVHQLSRYEKKKKKKVKADDDGEQYPSFRQIGRIDQRPDPVREEWKLRCRRLQARLALNAVLALIMEAAQRHDAVRRFVEGDGRLASSA